jgi:hypothetical protein
MTQETRKDINHKEYRFREGVFHIPAEELLTAIRQASRLYGELMDSLAAEIDHHASRIRISEGLREAADVVTRFEQTELKTMQPDRWGEWGKKMNTRWSESLGKGAKHRERVTWRLDPSNYDFLNRLRQRLRLTSMNAALNVILAENREGRSEPEKKVKGRKQKPAWKQFCSQLDTREGCIPHCEPGRGARDEREMGASECKKNQ